MRLIDADKLYNEIEGKYKLSCGDRHLAYRTVLDDICSAGTIEFERHGKWSRKTKPVLQRDSYVFKTYPVFVCSACCSSTDKDTTYCPNCGAFMGFEGGD